MSRNYQELHRYKGSLYGRPEYNGIEYDFEVPDNLVTASPGGVSTTQHHWTKGLYGAPSSTHDIYGGDGYRYQYGEFGNLYQVGQNATTEMGVFPYPPDQMYTPNQSTPHIDNFTKVPGMEMISVPDSSNVEKISPLKKMTHVRLIAHPFLLLVLVILLYAAIDLSVTAGESFLAERLHGGKTPTWKWLLLYAGIFLAAALLIGFLIKEPLFGLEEVE
jgi:hypothetical protein